MDSKEFLALAHDLFQQAYERQMEGDLEAAVELYRQSIEAYPTAEAHTFLGWTYSFQGNLDQAIDECKKAIGIDPEFGNPYNDIGAYLIELSRPEEAIPWLARALDAPRYETCHFAHYNMGRAYLASDLLNRARECFERAIEACPDYQLAKDALASLRRRIQ